MRKASRAMDAAFALEVLDKAPYVTVSFTRPDGSPYGVPLSLARTDEKTFYFHCAPEGEKLDCIAANPMVALSAVTRCTPTVGSLDRTAVVKITLTEPPTGKRKQYDKSGEEMKWGRME